MQIETHVLWNISPTYQTYLQAHNSILYVCFTFDSLFDSLQTEWECPQDIKQTFVFMLWFIRLWTKPWLNKPRLPSFASCSLKTQKKATIEGLWFCTWPPVLSLWVQCLFQSHHIALYPPALRDKAVRCKCLHLHFSGYRK